MEPKVYSKRGKGAVGIKVQVEMAKVLNVLSAALAADCHIHRRRWRAILADPLSWRPIKTLLAALGLQKWSSASLEALC